MASGGDAPDKPPVEGVPARKVVTSAELLSAALGYAARGWPVFPCNPKNKQPLLGADKDADGKPIRGTGGLKKASTDPEQIRAWWKRWPQAAIGLCTGHPTKGTETAEHPVGLPLFVLDFDPRVDAETGEVFGLVGLKADTEAQIGAKLPESMAILTPSDGVHLYLLAGDGGEAIRNRGNLPSHVDVRGLGGYVIAPPSVLSDGRRYRVHRKEPLGGIAKAPERLLEVLRERKGHNPAHNSAAVSGIGVTRPSDPSPRPSPARGEGEEEAVRKYALSALDGELRAVRSAASGKRNAQLNESALKIGALVAAGALDESVARFSLEAAARDNPGRDDDAQLRATIESGWSAGLSNPRDLSEIAANARARSERRQPRQPRPSGRGNPSAASPRTAAPNGGSESEPFRNGRGGANSPAREPARELTEAGAFSVRPSEPTAAAAFSVRPSEPTAAAALSVRPSAPTAADRCRLKRIAEAWLQKRLDSEELTPDGLKKIAWGCGCRIAAGHLDDGATRERLWKESEGVARASVSGPSTPTVPGVTLADLDRAIEQGIARGFDPGPTLVDLECGRYPLTDFGLAERFRDRFGAEFRFTTAKGWLGWDERRWKVLDQDKDTPPAELISAMFETVRLVQREAKRIRETGVRWELQREGKREFVDENGEPLDAALDFYVPKGKSFVRFSSLLAEFGRKSELAGKPAAIAALARRWLTVPIEHFDCEQNAVNCLNGTIRFVQERAGEDQPGQPTSPARWIVRLDPHRREDLITKLAPVEYDRRAPAPLYDGMIAWAQPDPAVRRYVHQVGGYSASGDTGEHKLWFNYGRGRNGKSVAIDSWCSALGDYSGTIGIESFLDQGIKKRGDAATPDLAKLGGVRMLRASEPERGAKLNSALIKAATGGEPMSVRALHRGFFDLLPRFKLLMSGNSKPAIPDTDEGIWGRMRLIPWRRHIEQPETDPYRDKFPCEAWPEKDTKLADKIKRQELAGVFARLIDGLVDYLEHGFVEPEGVTLATADYRNQSDPLGRFLKLCTEPDPQSRVKSSEFHELFAAWCKAAGEKEWTPVGFANALIDKGYTKVRSDGMRWEGLRLTRAVSDFVDHEGRVRVLSDDLSKEPDAHPDQRSTSPPSAGPPMDDDDDIPL